MTFYRDTLFGFLGAHIWLLAIAVIGMLVAALTAYARNQIDLGTEWFFAPFTRMLPWNSIVKDAEAALHSKFTLVELRLNDLTGQVAHYRKTSSYVVRRQGTQSYKEAVTAEGEIGSIYTMRGAISRIEREHGFAVAVIQFADPLEQKANLLNVFEATLHNCFRHAQEHWTQEVAYPTDHLAIVIRFPKDRLPRAIRSKRIVGPPGTQDKTSASSEPLFGAESILWQIEGPLLGDVYKLEWEW